jgi:ribosomal-protein-alanine N-acetyltransferase
VARAYAEGTAPLEDLVIERMRRRHLNRVLDIEAEVYPRPWSTTLFLAELAQPDTRSYFVAEHGPHVIGYGGLMFANNESHFTNMAVTTDFHGRKVGSRLFYVLMMESIAREVEAIVLEVRVSNVLAQAIYRRFGFVEVDTRKGYYVETKEDALVMALEDPGSEEYLKRLAEVKAGLGDIAGSWSTPA